MYQYVISEMCQHDLAAKVAASGSSPE